jgi:hypothetical protein
MALDMNAEPLPLFSPGDGSPAGRRHDLVERLDWVIHRRLEELPDTLVAALHAHGVACDRSSAPQELIERLRDGQPESRAAAS